MVESCLRPVLLSILAFEKVDLQPSMGPDCVLAMRMSPKCNGKREYRILPLDLSFGKKDRA